MQDKSNLTTYLKDHLAGASLAVRLLKLLAQENIGTSAGNLAESLLAEIEEDVAELENLLARLQSSPAAVIKFLGALAARISRWKLGSKYAGKLGMFEAWEAISLGIRGKRALWRALQQIEHEALPSQGELERLIQRANDQFERAEEFRLQLAASALSGR